MNQVATKHAERFMVFMVSVRGDPRISNRFNNQDGRAEWNLIQIPSQSLGGQREVANLSRTQHSTPLGQELLEVARKELT